VSRPLGQKHAQRRAGDDRYEDGGMCQTGRNSADLRIEIVITRRLRRFEAGSGLMKPGPG